MIRPTVVIALIALWLPCCGAPEEAVVDPEIEELASRLQSLGYVNLVPADDGAAAGVTRHDPVAAWPGLNLFNARHESSARLVTMDGRELHRWSSQARGRTLELFRQRLPSYLPPYLEGWNHVEMLDDGDLLVIASHHALLRLDWSSRLRWKLDIAAHHDLSVAPDGRIHVLGDGIRTIESGGEPVTFQDNQVLVVSPGGEVERRVSLMDAFLADPVWEGRVASRLGAIQRARAGTIEMLQERIGAGDEAARTVLRLYTSRTERSVLEEDRGIRNVLFHDRPEDLFHTNSIQVLERGHPGLWEAGDWLLCIREFDMIAVMDDESGRLLWRWGPGELERPHHATLLDDGSILLFDNGAKRGWSRIVRMDPRSGEIVWQYRGDPPDSFFSAARGGVQQLPNGNVLIADTDSGRAFEVTPEGETVWEYHSAALEAADGRRQRGAIYRMTRLAPSAVEPLLGRDRQAPERSAP